MDMDYALAWQFVDDRDGRPRQLRFRSDVDDETLDGTGQLIAVIADGARDDNHHTLAISRPNVARVEVERALNGWQSWARITDEIVNLGEIHRRIHAAGLD